jgi:hypothetical protein
MSTSGRTQKRGNSWARSASGLVLVAWLNLALQPCVMAMELDTNQDCRHCPTEVSHDHNHNQATDCSYVDSYNYDGRSTEPKPNDLPQDAPIVVVDIFDLFASDFPPKVSVRTERSVAHLGEPPLSILYCVYLI